MTDCYLRSADGIDTDGGSTWALARATAAAALTVTGDTGGFVYLADGHSEATGAAVTLTGSTVPGLPTKILCVVDTSDPEPPTTLATTGVIDNNANALIKFTGFGYAYGVTFSVGAGSANNAAVLQFVETTPWAWTFDNCKLVVNSTSASTTAIAVGTASTANDDQQLILNNTTVKFGHANQGFTNNRVRFLWKNTPSAVDVSVATPSILFYSGAAFAGQITVEGVDLSSLGSGSSLVDVSGAAPSVFTFRKCKLGSSVAITAGSATGPGGVKVYLYDCDSADTNYRFYTYSWEGTTREETTIVRTGGSSQKHNGSDVGYSIKMESSANASFTCPLESQPIEIKNETAGSAVTVAAELVNDGTTLTDAEAWIEVLYSGTAGNPMGSYSSDRKTDILATPANQTASSETWTTTGLTTPIKQKLAVTFTPQEQGRLIARVYLAKPSKAIYLCAKLAIS